MARMKRSKRPRELIDSTQKKALGDECDEATEAERSSVLQSLSDACSDLQRTETCQHVDLIGKVIQLAIVQDEDLNVDVEHVIHHN